MQAAEKGDSNVMPQKCAIAGCLNRSDDRERWVVMPHVSELSFHTCPNPGQLPVWTELIRQGHAHRRTREFPPPYSIVVCSNHFPQGQPSAHSPFPTLYLGGYDQSDNDGYVTVRNTRNSDHAYPKRRRCPEREKAGDTHRVEDAVAKPAAEGGPAPGGGRGEGCVLGGGSEQRTSVPLGSTTGANGTSGAEHEGIAAWQGKKGEVGGARLSQGTGVADSINGAALTGNCAAVSGNCAVMTRNGAAVSGNCATVSGNCVVMTGNGAAVCPGDATSSFRENSGTGPRGRAVRVRKRRMSRDTDHMYNTRKSKCVKLARNKTHRDTDHPYNSRQVTTVDNSCPVANNREDHPYNSRQVSAVDNSSLAANNRNTDHPYNSRQLPAGDSGCPAVSSGVDHPYDSTHKQSVVDSGCPPASRDTDHMYNMPSARLNKQPSADGGGHSLDVKAAGDRQSQQSSVVADNRAVDKDHMYQHSVRKNRQRAENKAADTRNAHANTQAKKLLRHKGSDTGNKNADRQIKKTVAKSENVVLPKKAGDTETTAGGTGSHMTRRGRKVWTGSAVKRQKTRRGATLDADSAGGCDPKQERTLSTAATASPPHSDVESDDSRPSGVGRTDPLYVHPGAEDDDRRAPTPLTDVNRQGPSPPLSSPCFSVEGYKQEHSYANCEEQRYAACVQCSRLVQQLIGTIRQQCDHIGQLRKKLKAANTRNKQLSAQAGLKGDGGE